MSKFKSKVATVAERLVKFETALEAVQLAMQEAADAEADLVAAKATGEAVDAAKLRKAAEKKSAAASEVEALGRALARGRQELQAAAAEDIAARGKEVQAMRGEVSAFMASARSEMARHMANALAVAAHLSAGLYENARAVGTGQNDAVLIGVALDALKGTAIYAEEAVAEIRSVFSKIATNPAAKLQELNAQIANLEEMSTTAPEAIAEQALAAARSEVVARSKAATSAAVGSE